MKNYSEDPSRQYHIQVAKGEVGRYVIMPGDPKRCVKIAQYLDNPDEYLSLDLKEFASAFSLFIQKKQRFEAVRKHYTRIERERASMEKRISYILQSVRAKIGQVFSFKDFIQDKKDRYDIVVTFMSLLEMAKARAVKVEQHATYGNIEVSAGERVQEEWKENDRKQSN